MVTYLNHEEMGSAIRLCYRAELKAKQEGGAVSLPFVMWGDPGIGKTAVVLALAREMEADFKKNGIEFGFWNTSLSVKNPEDIGGFPVPDHDTGTMRFFPPDDAPFLRKTKDGKVIAPYGIWLTDDLDRCLAETANAAMSIYHGRTINGNDISPNVYVCGTANGQSDAGSTSPLGGAFGNRLVHLYLRPDDGWSQHLGNHHIMGIERMLPIKHTDFQETARCTPRSVEMAMWITKARSNESVKVLRAVIDGCIGSEAGALLLKSIMRNVSLEDILNEVSVDYSAISIDDIDMLCDELNKTVQPNARPLVKKAVEKWAKGLHGDMQRILKNAMSGWDKPLKVEN